MSHEVDVVRRPCRGHRRVMTKDTAAEARDGIFDNVAGKAKEVAGAVAGNDELVEEGQLQQAEARKRKEAVADEAVADVRRQEATEELRERTSEAAQQQGQARVEAARDEAAIERERASEQAVADRQAAAQEATG